MILRSSVSLFVLFDPDDANYLNCPFVQSLLNLPTLYCKYFSCHRPCPLTNSPRPDTQAHTQTHTHHTYTHNHPSTHHAHTSHPLTALQETAMKTGYQRKTQADICWPMTRPKQEDRTRNSQGPDEFCGICVCCFLHQVEVVQQNFQRIFLLLRTHISHT